MVAQPQEIQPHSIGSMFTTPTFDGAAVCKCATSFIANHEGRQFLITNWHVVAGRHPDSGQCLNSTGSVPDSLRSVTRQRTSDSGSRFSGRSSTTKATLSGSSTQCSGAVSM